MYVGMLTSSRPTKRKTSSFAVVTSIAPALIIKNAPKNSPAVSSAGSSWARASRIRPLSRTTRRP